MKQQLSRRSFLQLMASLSAGTALVACAPPAAPQASGGAAAAPPAGEATKVSIQTAWFAQEEPGRDFWQRAIKMFAEKPENADVEVELINVAVTPEDFLTAIAGGTAPDIYQTYTGGFDVLEMAPKGVALSLDDFITQSKYIKLDDYLPQQWADKKWDGKTWALPVTEGGPVSALSWHTRYLEEQGLDAAKGPTSWEEVADWALKLTTYDKDGNVDVVGFDPLDAMGVSMEMWSIYLDAPLLSADKRTLLFDQGAWSQGLDIIKSIYQGIGVDKMTAYKQAWGYWTGSKSGFPNGKRAMIMNGYWQPGELKSAIANQSWQIGYNWVPCKQEGRKRAMIGSHSLWLTKNSQNPSQAFRFMEYILSLEVNLMEFELRGGFMWSKPLAAQLDTSAYPGLDFFMEMPNAADDFYSFGEYATPISGELNKLWNRAIEEVIYDQKSSQQALTDINTELQKAMDEAYKSTGG